MLRRRWLEQPTAIEDTLRGRLGSSTASIQLDEERPGPDDDLREVDKVFVVALRNSTYHAASARRSTPSSTGPASPSRSSWPPASSATATRCLDRKSTLVVRDQPVRRDRRHPRGRPAREDAATGSKRARDLRTPTARRSRASPMPCSTPAPGLEVCVAVDQDACWRRWRPSSSLGLERSRRRPRHQGRRRGRSASTTRPARCRTAGVGRAETIARMGCRSRSSPMTCRRLADGAVPRPTRRLPGRPRGCAQAQGTRVRACRGLPGGRAEARPDRADRGRSAGRRRHALTDDRRGVLHQKSAVEHRRGTAPAARARSWSPRTADDAVLPARGCRRHPRCRRRPHAALAARDDGAAAGARRMPVRAGPRPTTSTSRATSPSR